MNSSQNSKMGSKSNFNQKPQSQSQSLLQVPIPIDKFFKIKNLKFLCKVHNSEIGGVCDSFSCHSKNQLICIKCFTNQITITVNKVIFEGKCFSRFKFFKHCFT